MHLREQGGGEYGRLFSETVSETERDPFHDQARLSGSGETDQSAMRLLPMTEGHGLLCL